MRIENRIIVTGATGFVGRHLVHSLSRADNVVECIVRSNGQHALETSVHCSVVNSLSEYSFGPSARGGIVVHAAARSHIMKDTITDPLAEYRKINTDATLEFALKASASGVSRFVFISSIKVNGERTLSNEIFKVDDIPKPEDPYAISKYEAEVGLKQIAKETGMEVVIIRPPLIYGKGVKGNFANLMIAVNKGLPLPLGSIHNKRSLVGVRNLVNLIECSIRHPKAAGKTFLVSDGHDLSTTELLKEMIKYSGSKSILIPIPPSAIRLVATLLGKRDMSKRLLESLQVDISATKDILGWTPHYSIQEEFDSCFALNIHD